MLNTLKVKDYSKEELSNPDYLHMIYCLIFAKKHFAKNVIEDLVILFATIENISHDFQLDLYLALKMMIRFRFGDDLDKKRELLTMITKSVHESKHEKILGHEVEQKSLEELKLENAELKSKFESIISEKEKVISQKDDTIKKLKNLLAVNNVVF